MTDRQTETERERQEKGERKKVMSVPRMNGSLIGSDVVTTLKGKTNFSQSGVLWLATISVQATQALYVVLRRLSARAHRRANKRPTMKCLAT